MKKEKKKKINLVCFLTASICYYIISIINFTDGDTGTAITFLCLGSAFLCLSSTNFSKDKNDKGE